MSDCQCENEAKVLYEMYKKLGTYQEGVWDTPVCCRSEHARMVIQGETLTLFYSDGTEDSYTGNP